MAIYVWPKDNPRLFVLQVAIETDNTDLLLVPNSWAKQIAHTLIDPIQSDPSRRIAIRVIGTNKERKKRRMYGDAVLEQIRQWRDS